MTALFRKAQPIWLADQYQPDEYLQAADELTLDHLPETALLRIACDSEYTVYINGILVAFGQYAGYPFHRFYDEVDVLPFLRIGANLIRVDSWHYGIHSSTHRAGTAFVRFELEASGQILLHSGSLTRVRHLPGYVPHLQRRITGQLGLTYRFDFTDTGSDFHNASVMDIGETVWNIRPVEKLLLKDRCRTRPVQQGLFRIPGYTDADHSQPEKDMQEAALSFRSPAALSADPVITYSCQNRETDSGIYWIVDLGEETAGFVDLDLTVSQDCDLLVGFGEHLEDGRCRTAVRNFSCTLRLKAGRNQFLNTFRRFGCRYLQFFLFADAVTVGYSGLRPTVYPVKAKEYRSGNLLRDTIYQVAQNTLLHCMHEHYEDCPWREQALYTMDSRNQMLCGYYAFSETRFPRANLELISYGQRPDGLLSLCYPAGTDLPIPSFSLVWFIAMAEYICHSGDTTLAEQRFSVLESLLETFHHHRDEEGLVLAFRSDTDRYWNFYEWSETMDGKDNLPEATAEAPLNAFYCLALESMASICRSLGKPDKIYLDRAEAIRKLLVSRFFHRDRGLFTSFTDRNTDRYSVLTNSLCLLCGAADLLDTRRIQELLACNANGMADCIPDTLSMQIFRFDALLRTAPDKYGPLILDEIDRTCLSMLRAGATTFWETIKGEADFDGAGSLCHGWSALAIYYYETLYK